MADRPGEKEAAEEMKTKVAERKVRAFDYMVTLSRWDPTMIHHTGYKTVDEAILGAFKDAQKEVNKIFKAFLKKFPD